MNYIQSDEELVQNFLAGNEESFNRLAAKYQERIYWHARRMLGNHFDADEIVQQVLLVMYNKLQTFNFQSSLYTWIYKITSTRSLNMIKRNKLKALIPFDKDEVAGIKDNFNIAENLESKERLEKMEKLLQKIPTKQREVFILRNFDELSYDEISAITGKTVGTLKANYFHAFNKLKEMLKDDE